MARRGRRQEGAGGQALACGFAGLLADLGDPSAHAALLASTPARQQGVPRLFPPVQRVFNLVVVEAFCDQPGQPRLDPAKIDSSGLVLRRVVGQQKQAWLKAGTQVFGWEAVDESLDPADDRRGLAVDLGHPVLNALAPSQRAVRTGARGEVDGTASIEILDGLTEGARVLAGRLGPVRDGTPAVLR